MQKQHSSEGTALGYQKGWKQKSPKEGSRKDGSDASVFALPLESRATLAAKSSMAGSLSEGWEGKAAVN